MSHSHHDEHQQHLSDPLDPAQDADVDADAVDKLRDAVTIATANAAAAADDSHGTHGMVDDAEVGPDADTDVHTMMMPGHDGHDNYELDEADLDKEWTDIADIASPYLNTDYYGTQQADGQHAHGHEDVHGQSHGQESHDHRQDGGEHHAHGHADVHEYAHGADEHEHGAVHVNHPDLVEYAQAAARAAASLDVDMRADALGELAQRLQQHQQHQQQQLQHQHQHQHHPQPLGVGVGVGNIAPALNSSSASAYGLGGPSSGVQLGVKRSRSPSLGTGGSGIGVNVGLDGPGSVQHLGDGGGIGVGVGVGVGNIGMGNVGANTLDSAHTHTHAHPGSASASMDGTDHTAAGPSTAADLAHAVEDHDQHHGTANDNEHGHGNDDETPAGGGEASEPPNKRKRGPRAMRNKPPMQYWTDPSIKHLNLPATYEGRAIEYSRDAHGENGPVFVHPAPGTVQACIRCHTIKRKCDALEFDNATQLWTKAKCSGCEKSNIPCVFELAAASSGFVLSLRSDYARLSAQLETLQRRVQELEFQAVPPEPQQ